MAGQLPEQQQLAGMALPVSAGPVGQGSRKTVIPPPGFEQLHSTSSNGSMPENRAHRTIGPRATISENETPYLPEGGKPPVQAHTGPYRENPIKYPDRYTVPHTYHRHGEVVTVHCTLQQIESRIAQYERGLEECITRGLGEDIHQNRQTWLTYWKGKKNELECKMKEVLEAV